MPKREVGPEDPMEFVAVGLPGASEAALRDMALCFAEEFARDGWTEERLLGLFKNPFYRGPYLVWCKQGDDFVREVAREAIRMWQSPGGR